MATKSPNRTKTNTKAVPQGPARRGVALTARMTAGMKLPAKPKGSKTAVKARPAAAAPSSRRTPGASGKAASGKFKTTKTPAEKTSKKTTKPLAQAASARKTATKKAAKAKAPAKAASKAKKASKPAASSKGKAAKKK